MDTEFYCKECTVKLREIVTFDNINDADMKVKILDCPKCKKAYFVIREIMGSTDPELLKGETE